MARVRRDSNYVPLGTAVPGEILLPPSLPLEQKAVEQLRTLAGVSHPAGGRVVRVYAAPDFHPGDGGIPIGSAVLTEGFIIPEAVGSDINCGMRLHTIEATMDDWRRVRDRLVARLRGDYLLGTRDVVLDARVLRALFVDGLEGLGAAALDYGLAGRLGSADLRQIIGELDRTSLSTAGLLRGDLDWVPSGLAPVSGLVRDPGLGTPGGSNHFIEIQAVEEVFDTKHAYVMGLRVGQLTFMIHSGSRHVGKHVGSLWKRKAMDAWPKDQKFLSSRIFPLMAGPLAESYLSAQATAAHYGALNRIVLAELMRIAWREILPNVEAPLVYDLSHNLTFAAGEGRWLTRKGAAPADAGAPVLIPGSMGASSYVAVGLGSERHLCTASHGAGRSRSRTAMRHVDDLALEDVDCITLSDERKIEEAPTAYKSIDEVVNVQAAEGVIDLVARLRPLLTFKA